MATLTLVTEHKIIISEAELPVLARLSDIKDWQSVLTIYQQLIEKYPSQIPLFLLDEIGQCLYTSMHTSMNNGFYFDFDDTNLLEQDYKALPIACFKHNLSQLHAADRQLDMPSINGTIVMPLNELQALIQINNNPLPALDKTIDILLCPTTVASEAFAGKLNGYFGCDLNPYQNYTLIRYLEKKYNYQFFGMGASLLYFFRSSPLDTTQAQQLIFEVKNLYSLNDLNLDKLFDQISRNNYLILSYAESIARLIED